MVADSTRSVAEIAVTRFGLDRALVQKVLRSVLDAEAQGAAVDVVDALLDVKLLTPEQAREVRSSLDRTQIDPNSPKNRRVNGDGPDTPAEGNGTQPLVLGEYRILRRLGEGGMGAVFLAYQESADRQVAIKILPDHLAASQPSVDRFNREARNGLLLNHPNIVRNLDVGQDRQTGTHYLVLEYVEGQSAQALLERFGKLTVPDAVYVALEVAKALEHAHSRNVVHRDIKPANILITSSGLVKLSDLGLAKRTDETSHLTAARQGFGTPYYMPYEQAMNARQADARSDIFALGATLYHLLTGEVPFPGINHLEIVDKKNIGFYELASSLDPEVPAVLDQILEKMLAREPRDRYQSASELIVDLDRAALAPRVPSFVDADTALQDPVVRERLSTIAQPTAADLSLPANRIDQDSSLNDFWYLRFRDRNGEWCKAKATTEQIRSRLEQGKLTLRAEVSRRPHGEFLTLSRMAEFNQLASQDETPPSKGRGLRFWLAVVVTLGLIAGGAWLLLRAILPEV